MKANPICRVCKVILDSENWAQSCKERNSRICKECVNTKTEIWRKANPIKHKAGILKYTRQRHRPFNKNKGCGLYLGVHVAEQVLSKVFKDVEVMPTNHPGYDIICNRGKRIDVKSSCLSKTKYHSWSFTIRRNTTADYFLCLAFDNREDLTPLHAWLLPGEKFNQRVTASISPSTIHKWDEYRLDLSKISTCCDTMR